MALTNPTYLISLSDLQYFESKLAAKYQTQAITAEGITATTVVGALEELATSISGLPSAITPKGTKTFSQLAPATDLAAASLGFMWNISDAFTTTADFVEGAGKSIPAGANVYVAEPSTGVFKYDVFQGMVDLSNYKTKQTAVADSDATTSGTGVTFVDSVTQDTNGEITVHKKTVADVVASTSGTGGSAGLMTAAQAEQLASIASDIDDKANKVSGATSGNFAGLDSNGDLTDSGKKAADFATAAQGEKADSAIQSVKLNGTALTPDSNKAVNIPVASTTDIDEIFA